MLLSPVVPSTLNVCFLVPSTVSSWFPNSFSFVHSTVFFYSSCTRILVDLCTFIAFHDQDCGGGGRGIEKVGRTERKRKQGRKIQKIMPSVEIRNDGGNKDFSLRKFSTFIYLRSYIGVEYTNIMSIGKRKQGHGSRLPLFFYTVLTLLYLLVS